MQLLLLKGSVMTLLLSEPPDLTTVMQCWDETALTRLMLNKCNRALHSICHLMEVVTDVSGCLPESVLGVFATSSRRNFVPVFLLRVMFG